MQLDFTYLSAQNFLCFGSDGIELFLKKYGNVVLIRGNNLDVNDEERVASNGVGKSSIAEILVYTLFGKTIKHPKKLSHKNVINNQLGKGLRTEVRWGKYRVVRCRKPDSLRIWESENEVWDDEHEITLGGMPATQELIEDKLGLNYETFVNVIIFTDNNAGSFLECDTPTKREIVENLLSLDKYRSFTDTAKSFRNKYKEKINSITKEYESLSSQHKACEDRITKISQQETQWYSTKQNELLQLKQKAESKRKDLNKTDEGAALVKWEDAQTKIAAIQLLITETEGKQVKVEELLAQAQEKEAIQREDHFLQHNAVTSCDSRIRELQKQVDSDKAKIDEIESRTDTICQYCFGEVSEDNYAKFIAQLFTNIAKAEKAIVVEQENRLAAKDNANALDLLLHKTRNTIDAIKAKGKELSKTIVTNRNELNELNRIEKPKSEDLENQILQKQLESVLDQIVNKEKEIKGKSPFEEIKKSAEEELVNKQNELTVKRAELTKAEAELPYYEFWVVAFGDAGIRKFIIDGIIPALNSRIAYWLQFLIDGKITLEFDNQLDETISRSPSDGDPFVYHAMSGGERRRLNLAVSQAFAHVMMLNSGRSPSLVFLDEVTTNIDPIGVVGVYNMITELAKERQVFITTHDQDLLDLLQGCDNVTLEKKRGFTTLL